jgi:hypothetical protein
MCYLNVLVGNPEGRRMYRWDNNAKMDEEVANLWTVFIWLRRETNDVLL